MLSRALIPVATAVAIVITVAGLLAHAQSRPPLVIDSMAGKDLFRFYCASCHGLDGKGSGSLAAALRTPPANLTAIARRHGGEFPRSQVAAFVTGEEPSVVVAHGPRAMPVWGPIFRGLDSSDIRTKQRIENLVTYIASIQAK